jgi:sporulation protein YlmC with PRC-barrel domain
MIKLTDLLRELDIRKGNLGQAFVNDDQLRESFFYNFDLMVDDDSPVDESKINYNEISEVGDYKMIDPTDVIGNTKYLVKPSAKTWKEYIVGSVDVEEVSDKPYGLKGGQIVLTYISKPYRNQGLGALMYYMVLVHYKNLFSDNILYEGSRAIWTNKIYPATQLGGFFGIETGGFYAPLTLEDAKNDKIMKMQDVVSYVASTNPSPQMIKLQDYLDGLSLSKGEYGIYTYKKSSEEFDELVSDSESLEDVITDPDMIYHDIVANANPEAILVKASDVLFIVTKDMDLIPV